jgi:hypothetical protein
MNLRLYELIAVIIIALLTIYENEIENGTSIFLDTRPIRVVPPSPYIVTQFQRYGFVDIGVVDNGTRLIGTFYDSSDGNPKDNFTIIKK